MLEKNNFDKNKQRVISAILHKPVDRIPIMYRGLDAVHQKLLDHFGIGGNIQDNWEELMGLIGFDLFSTGNGIGKFTKIKPRYIGSRKRFDWDSNLFYAFGIESSYDNGIKFLENKEFSAFETISDMQKYDFPTPDDFSIENIQISERLKKRHFYGIGLLGSIFMISMYLRGADRLMVELLTEKKKAKYYIDKIGDAVYSIAESFLKELGEDIEFYALWDDMAMQENLMIPYESFKNFYYPWYKKIFELVKSHSLISYFHICGNANLIIPDLIDIGIDILDPIQTSAKDMELVRLKKNYGKDICFHGGIDVQKLLPMGKPEDIIEYVKKIKDLFSGEGGLLFGPSHDITPDTPVENILAVYKG